MCLDLHLRLHTNADGTFVTSIRYYDVKAYAVDDVATMEIGDWYLETDTIGSKLIYFVKGSTCPRGMKGAKGLRGVAGIQGPLGVQGPVGITGVQGERGPEGHYGTQGLVGKRGDCGERDERGEKGIQGDTSDVLSVLADHLHIQLATRYCEKICFVKYHVSEDRSSIVESPGGVQTLRNVSAYYELA